MSSHYFTEQPKGESSPRAVKFKVENREFELMADAGTFSAKKLDPGTSVLLKQLEGVKGRVLDIGCGWGPIAIAIATLFPETEVWALDVNHRSLEMVRRNAQKLELQNIRAVTASEIPEDLLFDEIWSNPPIRIGKAALHELIDTWLNRLATNGRAMLVVQKQLGAPSLMAWLQESFPMLSVSKHAIDKGYWVIKLIKLD